MRSGGKKGGEGRIQQALLVHAEPKNSQHIPLQMARVSTHHHYIPTLK
jgi:hypothetical protein